MMHVISWVKLLKGSQPIATTQTVLRLARAGARRLEGQGQLHKEVTEVTADKAELELEQQV